MNTDQIEHNLPEGLPPSVLAQGMGSTSEAYQLLCLAWFIAARHTAPRDWMTTTAKKRPAYFQKIVPFIHQCRAWLWLQRYNERQIHRALQQLPGEEVQPMREALNQLYPHCKPANCEVINDAN